MLASRLLSVSAGGLSLDDREACLPGVCLLRVSRTEDGTVLGLGYVVGELRTMRCNVNEARAYAMSRAAVPHLALLTALLTCASLLMEKVELVCSITRAAAARGDDDV